MDSIDYLRLLKPEKVIRTMSNRLQMGEEGIPWVNQSITAAARVIGVMFPKLNLKNEETLHDWLSRYKTEIETAFKYVRNNHGENRTH